MGFSRAKAKKFHNFPSRHSERLLQCIILVIDEWRHPFLITSDIHKSIIIFLRASRLLPMNGPLPSVLPLPNLTDQTSKGNSGVLGAFCGHEIEIMVTLIFRGLEPSVTPPLSDSLTLCIWVQACPTQYQPPAIHCTPFPANCNFRNHQGGQATLPSSAPARYTRLFFAVYGSIDMNLPCSRIQFSPVSALP